MQSHKKLKQTLLPFKAAIFDLDGVIVQTPHFDAWKLTFETKVGVPQFTLTDYATYVSGKPRKEGLRSFLEVSGIAANEAQIDTFAANKQDILIQLMKENGVAAYSGTVALIEKLRAKGVKIAVASSSENTPLVLEKAYLIDNKGKKIAANLLHSVDVIVANKRIITESKRPVVK